jgi:hypothetical protein
LERQPPPPILYLGWERMYHYTSFVQLNEKSRGLPFLPTLFHSSACVLIRLPTVGCQPTAPSPPAGAGLLTRTAPKAHSSSPATDRNLAVRLARAKAGGALRVKKGEVGSRLGAPGCTHRSVGPVPSHSNSKPKSLSTVRQKKPVAHSSSPATDRNLVVRLARGKGKGKNLTRK